MIQALTEFEEKVARAVWESTQDSCCETSWETLPFYDDHRVFCVNAALAALRAAYEPTWEMVYEVQHQYDSSVIPTHPNNVVGLWRTVLANGSPQAAVRESGE